MSRYDFKETKEFLNNSVPLDNMRDYIENAIHLLSLSRLTKKNRDEVWHTLLTCADFVDTIGEK